MANRILRFKKDKTGLWSSTMKTRRGQMRVIPHRRYDNDLKEGIPYICSLNKRSDTFIAVDIKPIEEDPLVTYYTDASGLGVFVTVFINGEEESALSVFYDRFTNTIQPKVQHYDYAMRDALLKTYRVADTDIEKYRHITSKRYLSRVE